MAPPSRHVITCYLYRNKEKLWTAEAKGFSDCKATCIQPEDTLRRIHTLVLEEIARRMRNDEIPLCDKLEVAVNVEIVSYDEAKRLLGTAYDSYDEYEDP